MLCVHYSTLQHIHMHIKVLQQITLFLSLPPCPSLSLSLFQYSSLSHSISLSPSLPLPPCPFLSLSLSFNVPPSPPPSLSLHFPLPPSKCTVTLENGRNRPLHCCHIPGHVHCTPCSVLLYHYRRWPWHTLHMVLSMLHTHLFLCRLATTCGQVDRPHNIDFVELCLCLCVRVWREN